MEYGNGWRLRQWIIARAGGDFDIVIGTPGRIQDLIEMGVCCLKEVSFAVLDDRARDRRLVALLEKYHKSQRGWKVVSIHGDKAQHDRTKALSLFKKGTCPLMVATDVAARGLDIPDVEVVINYSFPLTTEDYVHRIGRTG
ncbi:hypothetical protein VNO80_09036 [Phaseolus coccineus]|uniref:Helicase C-terminal domain-containing protein n=1 Tax=Phaseolus coccineus TaxID=3886 RepID=A0AAN9N5K6_PHACN